MAGVMFARAGGRARAAMLMGVAALALPATAAAQDTAADPAAVETERGQRFAAEAAEKLASGEVIDDSQILELPEPTSHWVYVTDPAHFAVTTKHFIIDGDEAKVLGVVDGGFLPHPLVPDDGSFFGQFSTVWSRIARGERTDYLEILDGTTLEPTTDIELADDPRFLIGTYPWFAALTPDHSKAMFYRWSPTPAVGVVDIAAGETNLVEVPDCYHIFPSGNDAFFMHCRDGSMLKVETGEGEPTMTHSEVFHTEEDFLINQPAYSLRTGRIIWPTYDGTIFQIDISSGEAEILDTIETFTEEEKGAKWALGGWQQVAYHADTNRIFILADQRDQWLHKTPSRHIFVIDAETGERIERIDLDYDIDSIAVSQDDAPQLYALSSGTQTLHIFDLESGEEIASLDELGHGPQVMNVLDLEQ